MSYILPWENDFWATSTNFSFPQNLSLQLRSIFLPPWNSLWFIVQGWFLQNSTCSTRKFPQKRSHQRVMVFRTYVSPKTNPLPSSLASYLAVPFQSIVFMGTRQWKSYTSPGKLPRKDAFDYMKQQTLYKVNFHSTCTAMLIYQMGKTFLPDWGFQNYFWTNFL